MCLKGKEASRAAPVAHFLDTNCPRTMAASGSNHKTCLLRKFILSWDLFSLGKPTQGELGLQFLSISGLGLLDVQSPSLKLNKGDQKCGPDVSYFLIGRHTTTATQVYIRFMLSIYSVPQMLYCRSLSSMS